MESDSEENKPAVSLFGKMGFKTIGKLWAATVFQCVFWVGLATAALHAQKPSPSEDPLKGPVLAREKLAAEYFGADAAWYLHNIPFLDIDDAEIQQIYYYRWKLYRSHVRQIGPQGTTVTEFLDQVPWEREPYSDLNDSASFHLAEGRWMRDPGIVNSLIEHLYTGGGNDRHFSESVAAATFETTLVTGDFAPAVKHLDTMQYIFNEWDDHFDRARNLYWIEPIADATEYTISSIDSSGAGFTDHPSTNEKENGFTKGFAFRPSINSYQYANARAIAEIAKIDGRLKTSDDYNERADAIRTAVLAQLWNSALDHFTDRYQRSTKYVSAGEFIRGRELVGYVPWLYELPPKTSSVDYAQAWRHVLSSAELEGPFGLRTVEPSYPRYLTQYRYDKSTGRPECQWNGPSWPFQTSQVLTGLANVLNDFTQQVITRADYLRLLRQYTHQHFLAPDHPDIQEDYDPDSGAPIVGLARSHHYNHSTYVDLILSGLVGIRPRADNMLEINPLLPGGELSGAPPIRYFFLQGVLYHGHDIDVVYDEYGTHYGAGKGLSVIVDGVRASGPGPLGRVLISLPHRAKAVTDPFDPVDLAANVGVTGPPFAAASSSISPSAVAEAVDGRMWFFPENPNGWSPAAGSSAVGNWFSIDFGEIREISSVELYFLGREPNLRAPVNFSVQYKTKDGWRDARRQRHTPLLPVANGLNRAAFPALATTGVRIRFEGPQSPSTFRLIELEVFGP
jgi:Amylo-alpha-1,6-glucosidase